MRKTRLKYALRLQPNLNAQNQLSANIIHHRLIIIPSEN